MISCDAHECVVKPLCFNNFLPCLISKTILCDPCIEVEVYTYAHLIRTHTYSSMKSAFKKNQMTRKCLPELYKVW